MHSQTSMSHGPKPYRLFLQLATAACLVVAPLTVCPAAAEDHARNGHTDHYGAAENDPGAYLNDSYLPPADANSQARGRQQLGQLVDDLQLQNYGLDTLAPEPSSASISYEEQLAASQLTSQIATSEWLGALSPVALSPFFGLTCLSAIAVAGDDYLPADHFLCRTSTPLRNPWVLASFAGLTLLTSLPKFSKVSKPFAQAADQVETYSALIILLVIRYMASGGGTESVPPDNVMYEAGMFSFSLETLLMLATLLNVLVINTIKFACEVMIWVTPIPLIDAIFELANKTACAGLAALYAYSPLWATVLNLCILAVCLIVFAWVKRREVFYRTLLLDSLRKLLGWQTAVPDPISLTVFPDRSIQNIPQLARCELTQCDGQWLLVQRRWFGSERRVSLQKSGFTLHTGVIGNKLTSADLVLRFSRRHNRQLDQLAAALNVKLAAADDTASQPILGVA